MSKTRHSTDGSVVVRTFPVTFLHDARQDICEPSWHQLDYAVRGHLEVVTGDTRRVVLADRAIWVPAGIAHTNVMRAPISMRSLYLATSITSDATMRTIAVSPLLRELILQICRIGALDRDKPTHARLIGVLLDLLADAEPVSLELPMPRDPRARAFAELVIADPGDEAELVDLARRAGASLRTLERVFVADTGLSVGAWRRRMRLFHALHRLQSGATTVTEVAFECGYATVSAFTHAFKGVFGTTPKLRRKREEPAR